MDLAVNGIITASILVAELVAGHMGKAKPADPKPQAAAVEFCRPGAVAGQCAKGAEQFQAGEGPGPGDSAAADAAASAAGGSTGGPGGGGGNGGGCGPR